ncbi:MAG: hypothetical protein K2X27_26905 [Candidatus Obscuribacterales bacterium]|nr:hypothetical protein [Candidatus Obscuribacterales bacterium]
MTLGLLEITCAVAGSAACVAGAGAAVAEAGTEAADVATTGGCAGTTAANAEMLDGEGTALAVNAANATKTAEGVIQEVKCNATNAAEEASPALANAESKLETIA